MLLMQQPLSKLTQCDVQYFSLTCPVSQSHIACPVFAYSFALKCDLDVVQYEPDVLSTDLHSMHSTHVITQPESLSA